LAGDANPCSKRRRSVVANGRSLSQEFQPALSLVQRPIVLVWHALRLCADSPADVMVSWLLVATMSAACAVVLLSVCGDEARVSFFSAR